MVLGAVFTGPGSRGLSLLASLEETLNDALLCFVELKQAANYPDKISSNNRNLKTGNLSGVRLIVLQIRVTPLELPPVAGR